MNTVFPLNSMKILEVFFPQKIYCRKLVESLQEERMKTVHRPVAICGILGWVKPVRKIDFAGRFSCICSTFPIVSCPLWTMLLQVKRCFLMPENSLTYPQIQVIKMSIWIFLPKSHNRSLMRKTSDKAQRRDILENTWPILLETVKIINNQEGLRSSHSQEELKEMWWLNVLWYPGAEKGH